MRFVCTLVANKAQGYLILDEVLAVGDEAFQQRVTITSKNARNQENHDLVTHDMGSHQEIL